MYHVQMFFLPVAICNLIPRFDRAVPQLSMVSNHIADIIFDEYGHLLRDLAQPWLSQAQLKQFADSIHTKGAPLETGCGRWNCSATLQTGPEPAGTLQWPQKALFNKISVRCGTQLPNSELVWSC